MARRLAIEATALRLVGLIYEAAEKPEVWRNFLSEIGTALRSPMTSLTIEDPRKDRTGIIETVGFDPAMLRRYEQHFHSVNLYVQRAQPLLRPGVVVQSAALCSDAEILGSEYYNDFLRYQELYHIAGASIEQDASQVALLSLCRPRRTGPFTPHEISLVRLLIPHMRRAARLHQTLSMHTSATAALDILQAGAMVLSSTGRILYANRAARELSERRDGLFFSRDGQLRAPNPRITGLLEQAISLAAQALGAQGRLPETVLALPRASGRRPLSVTILPVSGVSFGIGKERPAVVVLVTDPDSPSETSPSKLQRLFGLSPSEARLASKLAQGKGLREVADELQIGYTTARTHLQHLFDKLQVRRQSELVAVLLRAIGPLP